MEPVANRRVLLVGCGRMGSALLKGWLRGEISPQQVQVADPHPPAWVAELGIGTGIPLNPIVDIVVLAVKPQGVCVALSQIASSLTPGANVISIVAGVTLAQIQTALPDGLTVIRAMPNIPATIGRGVTTLFCGPETSAMDRNVTEVLMGAVGSVVWLQSEAQMDIATAVSGSGPAYVFHFAEALEHAAIEEGLPRHLAKALSDATIIGAAAMIEGRSETAAELRQRVTSPGGTTEAALIHLMNDKSGLKAILSIAVAAAAARSREIGGQIPQNS